MSNSPPDGNRLHWWHQRTALTALLALFLWTITVGIGLVEIVALRDLVLRLFALALALSGRTPPRYGAPYWSAVAAGQVTVLILGLVWVVFAIGSAEYHFRHLGERSSWRLLGRTVAVETAIALLALFAA